MLKYINSMALPETKAVPPTLMPFATKANRNRAQPWKKFADPKSAEHRAGIEDAPEQRYVGFAEKLVPYYNGENGG